MSLYKAQLDFNKVRPKHPDYDDIPPTTEYRSEPELPFSLVYLGGFCVLMLGIALGASIG
jgi:hypothetical protein